MGSLAENLERMKLLFVLIFSFINNGVVKSNSIDELLLAVNRIESNMETVLHKIENLENTIKDAETNVKSIREEVQVLQNEVEKNSNQNNLILELIGTLKEEVKSGNEEQNANHINLERLVEKDSNQSQVIHENLKSLKENMNNAGEFSLSLEKGLKLNSNHSNMILQHLNVLKDEVSSIVKDNRENIEDIGLKLLGSQKLYSDVEYEYYKIMVPDGTHLAEGTVPFICEKVGMKAVCNGADPECSNLKFESDLKNCTVTPLTSPCQEPMYALSKILCDVESPKKCSQLDGVFMYTNGWAGGECGAVDGKWCAVGNWHTSGELREGRKRMYYGLCAKRK